MLTVFLLLHLEESFSQFQISSLADIIQNLLYNTADVWLVPAMWFSFSWYSYTISLGTALFLFNTTGYFILNGKNSTLSKLPITCNGFILINHRRQKLYLAVFQSLLSWKGSIFLSKCLHLWHFDDIHLNFFNFLWCQYYVKSNLCILEFFMNLFTNRDILPNFFQLENSSTSFICHDIDYTVKAPINWFNWV